MHIFLNPPHMFWGIADTEIRLTRGEPLYELEQEEIDELTPEELAILNLSIQAGTITKINPEFIPKVKGKTTIDFILSRRASEIQRTYVSRMIMAKDRNSLIELRDAEQAAKRPRQSVIQLLSYALKTVGHGPGGEFYEQIEEIEDDLEGEAPLPMEAVSAPRTKKPRPQRKRGHASLRGWRRVLNESGRVY